MPKKTRKAKIRAAQRPVAPGYVPAPRPADTQGRPTPYRTPVAGTIATGPIRSVISATMDYGYVFRDLRRIGLLALLFFAIMFVLWFLIEVQHIPLIPGIL
jgi:hypothetical protein